MASLNPLSGTLGLRRAKHLFRTRQLAQHSLQTSASQGEIHSFILAD